MPKKGKVNKLARMSDEERARYLQHRADVEEEARRRKRELIARFIKNKLDKEESFAKINTAKINQEWRYILRRIKCKQMAVDIQGMMSSFNFLLDRKNRLLSFLMSSIEDSDDQHRRAFQAHTETLSYFLKIGSQRLDKLQSAYEFQKNNFLETWDKEEMDITDNQDRAEFKLTLVTYIQDRDFQIFKKEKEIQRATEKNDARLEYEEEMHNLCKPKQLEIDMYWTKLRDVYNMYLEKHNPIMAHYNTLREKDEFYQSDIAKNEIQIQHATEVLITLQSEWIKSTNVMNNKLRRMNNHKEELAKKHWQMKRETKVARGKEEEMLAVLVDASQDAIKRLESVNDKLEKIKQMGEICNKYEKDNDKLVLEEPEDNGAADDFETLDSAMIVECKEYKKMDKFLLKVNRVKVQTMCLRTERIKLAKENIQLKQYIKRYLTELALKGGKERPLSMKIQSEMQKMDLNGKLLNRPVTCIEGALSNAVLHEKRMKLEEKKIKELGSVRAYPRVFCS
ncbi:dynein regulatory complex subunit 2 [Maniola hyperantus]|uniref:dynein regulatory complex subunit 2 n=1 Tax=Aphantopus hyperantus TaxID=2795564 RepID=UPI001569DED7|nr:dynein regulatory complex subunit 2 [Maniola hyperantus]